MTYHERIDTAPDEHLGFELNSMKTALYAEPNVASTMLATLARGVVVTVLDRTPGFLRVVTNDDRFGYILDSTPLRNVEGRTVDGWTVQIPDLEATTIPMTGRVAAPFESSTPGPPDVTGLGGAQRRNALNFLSRVGQSASENDAAGHGSALFAGIIAAAIGMAGLLVAHAIFGLSNNELMFFFAGDVLFPLFVLTGSPKSPTSALGLGTVFYYVAVFGYGGLGP